MSVRTFDVVAAAALTSVLWIVITVVVHTTYDRAREVERETGIEQRLDSCRADIAQLSRAVEEMDRLEERRLNEREANFR